MQKNDFKVCLWYHTWPKETPPLEEWLTTTPEVREKWDKTCAVQVRRCEAGWQVQTKKADSWSWDDTIEQIPGPIYHVFECGAPEEAIDWVFTRYEVYEWENGLRDQLKMDIKYLDKAICPYDHEIAQRIRYVLEKMTGKE